MHTYLHWYTLDKLVHHSLATCPLAGVTSPAAAVVQSYIASYAKVLLLSLKHAEFCDSHLWDYFWDLGTALSAWLFVVLYPDHAVNVKVVGLAKYQATIWLHCWRWKYYIYGKADNTNTQLSQWSTKSSESSISSSVFIGPWDKMDLWKHVVLILWIIADNNYYTQCTVPSIIITRIILLLILFNS